LLSPSEHPFWNCHPERSRGISIATTPCRRGGSGPAHRSQLIAGFSFFISNFSLIYVSIAQRPMRGFLFRFLLLLLLLAPCCARPRPPAPPLPPVAAPDFTIVALPDPQMYSEFNPEIFKAQTDWIVKHAADQNIKLVAILGDLVNDGDSASQYANADAAV